VIVVERVLTRSSVLQPSWVASFSSSTWDLAVSLSTRRRKTTDGHAHSTRIPLHAHHTIIHGVFIRRLLAVPYLS
jgi:hypothetical protein